MIGLPRTLFGRTAALLLGVFLLLQGLALAVAWKTVIAPLAERSAEDLSTRMLLAAQTWVELPPETRPDYELELSLRHGLELGEVKSSLVTPLKAGYFEHLVAVSLSKRVGHAITLKQGPDPAWVWAEVEIAGHLLRVGFLQQRYALEAPWEAIAVFFIGALLTLTAALLVARQTSQRLMSLARSAKAVGQGRLPESLPETGAEEIGQLTRAFNQMAAEVQALLENRTTLLAGVSHDLKTPITRMRLTLAMMADAAPAKVARLEADLAEMERLINDMLDFARSLQLDQPERLDLVTLLRDVAGKSSSPQEVHLQLPEACPISAGAGALRRILANLLENALRYGAEQPVELALECADAYAAIRVLDRGPGIPATEREAVFRPFYRIESSRSRDSGGSGLGLAIARQLADAYGWRIELSDRPGGGLIATLMIPVSR